MAIGRSSNDSEGNGTIMSFEAALRAAANSIDKKKHIKRWGLNLGIAAANIIIFSPALIGLRLIGGSALEGALGCAIIFASGAGLVYGNYKILIEPKIVIPPDEIRRRRIIEELNEHHELEAFKEIIDLLLDQTERLEKKKKNIGDILPKIFIDSVITCNRFYAAIAEVENIFFTNMDYILIKIKAFDEKTT